MTTLNWAAEFANVISCMRCSEVTCKKLLRDADENVPQPGFVGERFHEKRILLVGQNPGTSKPARAIKDKVYTSVLRQVRDDKSVESWTNLQNVLLDFVPDWPVNRNYFPLEESGLSLSEIAYCNLVRCRTKNDHAPSSNMTSECADNYFVRWLDLLKPRAIIFIGKWSYDRGSGYVRDRQIPCDFMNRERSLTSAARIENRMRVVALIRSILEQRPPFGQE